jgi:hypothetical protein
LLAPELGGMISYGIPTITLAPWLEFAGNPRARLKFPANSRVSGDLG